MKAKLSILALAMAGLFAATASALASGPGPQAGGMGMMGGRGMAVDPAQQVERVQARLERLKAALQLAPNQLEAFNAYAARVVAEAQLRAEMRQEMIDQRGDPQAMADHRAAMMKQHAQAAEELAALRDAVAATLNAGQKATFEQYAIGPRLARGPGAEGFGRGFGPGYAPGSGDGRGPGFGRGCMGNA